MSQTKTVLLVDDDVDLIEMHKAALEDRGYRVLVAYNGCECLEKAAGQPDAIVLDIMMASCGDGMYAAQDLRKQEATKDIPILVMTSVNESPSFNLGPHEEWLPVDRFLEKPVLPQQLVAEVERLLGSS